MPATAPKLAARGVRSALRQSATSIRPDLRHRLISTTVPLKDTRWPQRLPRGEYYDVLLSSPPPYPVVQLPEKPSIASVGEPTRQPEALEKQYSETPTIKPPEEPKNQAASEEPMTQATTAQEKARIIFGSRLIGPAEEADRLATKQAKSTYIAGVLIPPRPEEPDNCCMSGCVNCVYDRYREDLEEWSAQNKEAQARLKAGGGTMDADGGGSETNWRPETGAKKIAKDMWDDEVFQSVPVGIREFMKQEKKLKERHQRDGTPGG